MLARALLASRSYLLILRSKPDDVQYATDRKVRSESAALQAMSDQRIKRIEVIPEYDEQAPIFEAVLDKAYKQGGWSVFVDEGFELRRLGLVKQHEKLLTQGRSKGISVVTGVQRPSYVSRFTFSESRHVLSFHHEGRDVKVMRDAFGEQHAAAVAGLDDASHQFAWSYGGKTWVGRLQDLQSHRGRPAPGSDVGDARDAGAESEGAQGVRQHHAARREE